MFVDESLFANIRKFNMPVMADSTQALYHFFWFLDRQVRQGALSFSKCYVSTCLYQRVQLGKEINTRLMMVTMVEDKNKKVED